MDTPKHIHQLDWNHLRAFLHVAEIGSLTGASKALFCSQPTLSRIISELETSLNLVLFERLGRGLRLTEAGRNLVEPARQMQRNAEAFTFRAVAHSQNIKGTIRITASELLSGHILPPIITEIRQKYPEIQIELLATDQVVNVLERQADIAIRHTNPKQADTIAKKIGNAKTGLFAHKDYLKRVGGQIVSNYPGGYDWIGLDRSDIFIKGFKQAGKDVGREFFNFRCDNVMVGWQVALAGGGIVPSFFSIAEKWADMELICPETSIREVPIWLVVHRELLDTPRMRIVFDILAARLKMMVTQ